MKIRTQLKAGRLSANHNATLQVRSALKAGKIVLNHNEGLQVRSTLKAGGLTENHSEGLQVRSEIKAPVISMRRKPPTTRRPDDRLELLVVRAGLRAGRRMRSFGRR